MARRAQAALAPRKRPRQARSAQLVADILEAAIRVLRRDGGQRFTTIRVAAEAGVSVGSLYQYFPNKQAIIFRLQTDEWAQTAGELDALLTDRTQPPAVRLRNTVRAFFHSECAEAPLRLALDAAAPDYHAAPEATAHRRRSRRTLLAFVRDAAPRARPAHRTFAADLISATLSAVGKQLSEQSPAPATVDRWADAVAAMLMSHLAQR